MKAFLLGKEGRFPKIHPLVNLLDLCKSIDPAFSKLWEDHEEEFNELDKHYVSTRYPDLSEKMPARDDAEKGLELLNKVIAFVEERIG